MAATTAQEIARDKWKEYFRQLSKLYLGWGVSVELLHSQLGDQPFSDGLPLQGISFDDRGSQSGDILIEVGDAGTAFQTHLIHRPTIVRIAHIQPGVEIAIEAESEEGYTTLVRLWPRPALKPPGS